MPEPRELHPFSFTNPAVGERLEGDYSISYTPSDSPAHDEVVKPDPKGSSAQAPVFSSKSQNPDVPLPEGYVIPSFIIPGDKKIYTDPVIMEPEVIQQQLPFVPTPPLLLPTVIITEQKDETKIVESDMSPAAEKGNTKPKAVKNGTPAS